MKENISLVWTNLRNIIEFINLKGPQMETSKFEGARHRIIGMIDWV